MRAGVTRVFAPNPAPPEFVQATRVPLVLRPFQYRSNCEDVVNAMASVAALSPRYRAIHAPTEIVAGDSDGVVSTRIHASGCAHDISGARLTILSGVGHSPHHTAADRVVEIVLEAERRASERAPEAASGGAGRGGQFSRAHAIRPLRHREPRSGVANQENGGRARRSPGSLRLRAR